MKKMQDMGGFFVAAVTPYDEQGRFSAPALHKLMDKTIAEGAKGFLIGGSSAECPLLTHEERVEGLQAAAQYENREKTKLMASVAAISTDEAIEYAKTAKALGYDAMISTVPYYYKFGMKAISAYYGALREAVDLPLFLYNFPGNTGVELDIADDHIRGMLTDGTIAGVKQTSLNLYQMERIRDLNPELVIYGGTRLAHAYEDMELFDFKDIPSVNLYQKGMQEIVYKNGWKLVTSDWYCDLSASGLGEKSDIRRPSLLVFQSISLIPNP